MTEMRKNTANNDMEWDIKTYDNHGVVQRIVVQQSRITGDTHIAKDATVEELRQAIEIMCSDNYVLFRAALLARHGTADGEGTT